MLAYGGSDPNGRLAMRNEAEQNKAKKTAIHLIKLGKMTLEEIAEATELSLDTVKELENQTMQLA